MRKQESDGKKEHGIIVLAAGAGKRFGGNKLFAKVNGTELYLHTLSWLKEFPQVVRIVVTGYGIVKEEALREGITVIDNFHPEYGISYSLKLGLKHCVKCYPDIQNVLFSVCDQPGLTAGTIQKLFIQSKENPGKIICSGFEGRRGNPVLWDRRFFPELLDLQGDMGGRQVMIKHLDDIIVAEVDEQELDDIDYPEDVKGS